VGDGLVCRRRLFAFGRLATVFIAGLRYLSPSVLIGLFGDAVFSALTFCRMSVWSYRPLAWILCTRRIPARGMGVRLNV